MADAIATSVPVAQAIPQTVKPLPVVTNTGFMVPDEVFAFLDISDPKLTTSTKVREKIGNILHYYWEQNQGGDIGDILSKMSESINTFGAPRLGSNRLEQLFNFVTIQRQIGQLQKKQKAIING